MINLNMMKSVYSFYNQPGNLYSPKSKINGCHEIFCCANKCDCCKANSATNACIINVGIKYNIKDYSKSI